MSAARSGPAAWLVKSEPFVYSFDQLIKDGRTTWDGVRSHEAKNNLAAMKAGDLALFYHSNEGKAVVGLARIAREAYPDPHDDAWVAVDLVPLEKLANEVPLATIKADTRFAAMALVKKSRLSVGPVTAEELAAILQLGAANSAKTTAKAGSTASSKAPAKKASRAKKTARTAR